MATSAPSGLPLSPGTPARWRAFATWVESLPIPRLLRLAYVLWAGVVTLLSVRFFCGYLLKQTGGEWSAPLDDVFIHFDYARSTAEGAPFQWVPGNGYSSGNTSLSYPFVLALGYLAGYRDLHLVVWAEIVAAVSVFGVLLVARELVLAGAPRRPSAHETGRGSGREGGRGSAPEAGVADAVRSDDRMGQAGAQLAVFALPPLLLGVGALCWSLWSGMEVAFFLGVWALGAGAWLRFVHGEESLLACAAWLGIAGAALVVTRPEASTTVACFGVTAVALRRRHLGLGGSLKALAFVGVPAVAVLIAQAVANRILTGEWSAAGALVKLAANNPYMSFADKLADYRFNIGYAVFRNLEYHFADKPAYGCLLPALALAGLARRETRPAAVLLWTQVLTWLAIVALNGQVRWQNERYTMPAVAWLTVAAAVGVRALWAGRGSALVHGAVGGLAGLLLGLAARPGGSAPTLGAVPLLAAAGGAGIVTFALRRRPLAIAVSVAALALFFVHQEPRMRDQRWFFGRAARNIRDQHVRAGRFLAALKPNRVLVGDAGALLYASWRPGLDIIGLGGYHDLPFARASVHGLPATLELIERMPRAERPEVMALYPTWWGVLPTWFSSEVIARFPVEGNVICGGYEKVIYRADWRVLGTGALPRVPLEGAVVRDEVDVADLVSERAHRYGVPGVGPGFPDMKILPDPADPAQDLFDGGRRVPRGRAEAFTLHGLLPATPGRLVVRSAPEAAASVRVRVDGREVSAVTMEATEGWVEAEVPFTPTGATARVELVNEGPGDFVSYHLWMLQ